MVLWRIKFTPHTKEYFIITKVIGLDPMNVVISFKKYFRNYQAIYTKLKNKYPYLNTNNY